MSAPIFYCQDGELKGVVSGDEIELLGEEGHHARNVKRLSVGEPIDLSDTAGKRVIGEVIRSLDQGLVIKVRSVVSHDLAQKIYLVQALAKNDRDILGIETATELGVAGVIPWQADRSIVRWRKERLDKHQTKWENTVRAAAKQSRSASIPTVFEVHSSVELAEVFSEDVAEGASVFILHEQGQESFTQAVKRAKLADQALIYLVVGPEGGIAERELELFESAGAQTVLLGHEVLRSSTAGAAALVVLKTLTGQW